MNIDARKKLTIKFLLFAVPFLIGTGVDLYVPSLPFIAHYFGVHDKSVQLSIAFYMLGYGVGQIILGSLSDSLGRKKILVVSALFYTVISFIAVFSINITMLNSCRFIQGLWIAGFGVLTRAIATDCFSQNDLTKVMTFISISFALGPIVGPFIGGYLQHYFNWKADFYFFSVYGLFVLLYSLLFLPETHTNRQPLQLVNLIRNIRLIVLNTYFILFTVFASLIYSMLVMFNTVAPFLIQRVLGFSVVSYGHIALLLGFGYFSGNLLNRFLLNYVDSQKILSASLLLSIITTLVMVFIAVNYPINLYHLIIPVFILFFFCGLIFPNAMSKCVAPFSHLGGTASAVFGTMLGVTVFFMTSFSSFLKTHSQIPLSITYLLITVFCLILLIAIRTKNNNERNVK